MRPRGYVVLLGGLTAFTGYTLAWWGWLFIQGYSGPGRAGPGLIDLVMPSRLCTVRQMLAAGAPGNSIAGTVGTGKGQVLEKGPPLASLAGPGSAPAQSVTGSPLPQIPGYKGGPGSQYPPQPGQPGGNPLGGQSIR